MAPVVVGDSVPTNSSKVFVSAAAGEPVDVFALVSTLQDSLDGTRVVTGRPECYLQAGARDQVVPDFAALRVDAVDVDGAVVASFRLTVEAQAAAGAT